MKVRTKLTIGFSLVVVLIWITVFFAVNTYENIQEEFIALEEDIVPGAIAMSEMKEKAEEIKAWSFVYMIRGDAVRMGKPVKEWLQQNMRSLEKLAQEHREHKTHIGLEEQKDAEELENRVKQLSSAVVEIINLKDQGAEFDELIEKREESFTPVFQPLITQLEEHKAVHMEELAAAEAASHKAHFLGMRTLFLSAGLITLLAAAAAFLIVRSIVKPLHALHRGTEIIGQGNLDYQVGTKAKDEIGQLSRAFDQMTRSLTTSVTSIHNLNREITERKQAEEALRESEEKFSKAFRASPDMAVISTLRDGIFVEVNDSFTRIIGYTREEAIGHSSAELGIWVKAEERARIVQILKERGRFRNEEVDLRIKSGEIRLLLFSAELINIGDEPCMLSVTTDITERKQAEEVLRESEERLSVLFEFAPDAYYLSNLKGDFVDGNRAAEELTGYKRDELIGKSFLKLKILSPRQIPRAAALLAKNVLGQPTGPDEFVLKRKDGHQVSVEIRTFPVKIKGQVLVLGIARDITERKRAEAALQEKNEQLDVQNEELQSQSEELAVQQQELVGKNTELAATNTNLHEAQQALNERLKELGCLYSLTKIVEKKGITLDELYQETVNLLPGGWQYPEVAGSKITVNGSEFKTENYRVSQWRQSSDIKVYGEKIGDVEVCYLQEKPEADEGPFLKEERLVLDAVAQRLGRIIERKQAEEELKLRAQVLNGATDSIFLHDFDGNFIYVNESACRTHGYSREEFMKMNLRQVVTPERASHLVSALQEILEKGQVIFESDHLRKDGSIMPVEVHGRTIESGGRKLFLTVIRDITERKQAEEERRELDRMKSEFLSSVSHELRNPLHSARGFVKLMLEDNVPDPGTQKEFLAIVDKETLRLTSLIDDLLDMSRLEAGQFQIQKQRLPIRDVIHEVIMSFAGIAREKNIIINEDMPAALPDIEADGNRIKQVTGNLLDNAIKFSDGGSITVKSAVRDDEMLVQVTDQGIGIPEEAMPHLFERFFRAKDNMARGGTGLGLYISKQIVEAHGGRIWAESKEGEGSTFSFTLPFDKSGGDSHE